MMKSEEWEARQNTDLERLKSMGSDDTFQYHEKRDFSLSPYWFKVEVYTSYGRILSYCFSCKTLDVLKESVRMVLTDTCFTDAVTFVKGCSYVTFRKTEQLDRDFAAYYGHSA